MRRRYKFSVGMALTYAVLVLVAAITLYPLVNLLAVTALFYRPIRIFSVAIKGKFSSTWRRAISGYTTIPWAISA